MSGQISEAIERWADEVAGLGGSEPLTRYRDLKSGTLDLGGAEAEARKRLVDGEPVRVSRLFPHDPLRITAGRSARRLAERLWALQDRHGLAAGYLVTGLATWSDRMSARRPMVPILLRRVQVQQVGFSGDDLEIHVVGEPELNEHLLTAMADQLGLRLTAADLLDPSGDLRYPVVVDRLREQAPAHIVDGFTVHHRAVVAAMSAVPAHQAAELRANAARFSSAPLLALAAGAAAEPVHAHPTGAEAEARVVPPIDLDSAQTAVLVEARAGRSLAVETPPGTGATQVAAALCAQGIETGSTVLVVAEAAPRLHALAQRLAQIGLGGAVLDLADGLLTAPALARDVLGTLGAAGGRSASAPSGTHPTSHDQAEVSGYHTALHRPRAPWGISAYEAISRAAAAPADLPTVSLDTSDLSRLDAATLARLRDRLGEFVELDGLRIGPTATAWFGAAPATDVDAERSVDLVGRLRDVLVPAARELSARAAAEVGMPAPAGPAQAGELVDLLEGVEEVERTFTSAVWSEPVDRLAAATAERRDRRDLPDAPGLRERRALRAQAVALARQPAERAELSGVLGRAAALARRWGEQCRDGRLPRTGETTPAAVETVRALQAAVTELSAVHPEALDAELDFSATAARLSQLADEASWVRRLPRLNMAATELADAGLGPLVAALRERVDGGGGVDPASATAALDASVAGSLAAEIQRADPVLANLDAAGHREAAAAWQAGDTAEVVARAQHIRSAWVERVRRAATERPVQTRALRDAAAGRDPRTVRSLVERAGDTLRSARPVWLAGPLTAADGLPPTSSVDLLVVMDAQSVAMAHAIGVLARARQVVVLGDPQAPPPTPTPVSVEAPDPRTTAPLPGTSVETPSVLAVLRDQVPTHVLTVRYGCRDERLHALLPATRAGAPLAVPPGSSAHPPVRFEPVEQQPGSRDQEESVAGEVAAVVDLVRRHVAERPGVSLAVLTLGSTHANAVRAALGRACLTAGWLAEALGPDAEEPFLLRPVDDLQGERRDAVVLSVGYGRTVDGRLLYRFGPLNRPGGVRWLNAALAVARAEVTVCSSIRADELEPRRLAADGVRALRDLLAAAEGVEVTEVTEDTRDEHVDATAATEASTDPFVGVVHERLRAAGLPVVAGGGTGALEVPLVLEHPGRPGRGVLAVETEGGPYRDLPTVRDRERIRPEQLRRSGWAVHRVCTAGWARDADAEVEALREAMAGARALADAQDAARNAPSPQRGESGGEPAPGGEDDAEKAEPDAPPAKPAATRGPRPPVVPARPVEAYPPADLMALAGWLDAGLPEADTVAALAREIGLMHPEDRAEALLRQAVRAARVAAAPAQVPVPDPLADAGADAAERQRERSTEDEARDQWLEQERPPHHE